MIFCKKCGKQIEDSASFCPNCGVDLTSQSQSINSTAPQDVSSQSIVSGKKTGTPSKLGRSIKAGTYGFVLAVIINLFSPIYLDFLPSFLAAILLIYIFRLETFQDGLIVSFITYIFKDATLNTLGLASIYLANEPYLFSVDITMIPSPMINAITATIAGYLGVRLVHVLKSSSIQTLVGGTK